MCDVLPNIPVNIMTMDYFMAGYTAATTVICVFIGHLSTACIDKKIVMQDVEVFCAC